MLERSHGAGLVEVLLAPERAAAADLAGLAHQRPAAEQVGLELEFARGFVPRPNLRGEKADDWDDRVADLQFRDIEAFDRRRRTIVKLLSEIPGVEVPTPQGAFYVYPSVRGLLGRELRGRTLTPTSGPR